MRDRPKIQLKPSQYTMASLMANSRACIDLDYGLQRSRLDTLTLSKASIPDSLQGSICSAISQIKCQSSIKSKQNSIPYHDSRINSERKKTQNVSKFYRSQKEQFYQRLMQQDQQSRLQHKKQQKYSTLQRQFISKRQHQIESQIKQADYTIDKLQNRSNNLQRFIQDQEVINDDMCRQNVMMERKIQQLKILASKLQMLQKLNNANQKQMDKNRQEWFQGKNNLIEELRNDLKGQVQSMKIKKC